MSHSEIQKGENGVRSVGIVEAIADEPGFFRIGKRISLFGLIAGQNDFCHGRRDAEIVGGDVEDTAQKIGKFFRRPMFAVPDKSEQIILQSVPVDVRQRSGAESRKKVFLYQSGVFFESGRFDESLFDFQPFAGKLGEIGLGNVLLFRTAFAFLQSENEFFFQRLEISCGDFDMQIFSADTRFVHAVLSETIGNDHIPVSENFTVFEWHFFHLLFGERDALFLSGMISRRNGSVVGNQIRSDIHERSKNLFCK